MSDSKCLARAALRTDLHLACVDGPDVGLVLAPGTVGRAGDVPLSCASVAREHAEFSTRGGRACLRASPHTSPIRVRTRMRGWHRLRGRKWLAPGRRVRLGGDTLEVRGRPQALTWPGIDRRGRGVFSGSSLLRGAPLVSLVVMGGLMAWRLHTLAASPRVLWTLAGVVAVIACVVAVVMVLRARKRRRGWDGAALALVLASLPATGEPTRIPRAAVWPGRATRLGRRVILAATSSSSQPGDAASLGIVGEYGAECALWCAGQVAAQLGGARVWWRSHSPVLLGCPALDIHVTGEEECPYCARGGVNDKAASALHIGYAAHVAELPSWCARVCVTDERPVSTRWWWTVTRTTSDDALPERVDWDPDAARGHSGTLSVVIGHSEAGPVELDLVTDGPHALVAGCTGSGKVGGIARLARLHRTLLFARMRAFYSH